MMVVVHFFCVDAKALDQLVCLSNLMSDWKIFSYIMLLTECILLYDIGKFLFVFHVNKKKTKVPVMYLVTEYTLRITV